MKRPYKITYKTYFNDRLKKVSFHGVETHPLYIQITYRKRTIFFKSYYFELFSHSRYSKGKDSTRQGPSLDFIIKREYELMDFIVKKYREEFSLETFKAAYGYYSQDLCTSTEEAYRAFMVVFFTSKKLSVLGLTLVKGSKEYVLHDLLKDMAVTLQPAIYEELTKLLSEAPPYLPLYGFTQRVKKWPDKILTVMEWEQGELLAKFMDYLQSQYPDQDAGKIKEEVDRWLDELKTI